MPARDSELQMPEPETAPEVAPVEPEVAKTEFATEGELPAVAETTATAATATTASELAFGEPQQQDTSQLDQGMHNWEDYKATCEKAGKPEKWKDYYRVGHTEAKGWTQPHDSYKTYFDFHLEKGNSASKALTDFIAGPTIADYRVAGVAADLDELRDEFGDQKFDKLFGSANGHEDAAIPMAQRLHISAALYSVPLIDQMKAIARDSDAHDNTEEPTPAPVQEARAEEKPKATVDQDQEPLVVAQELGMQQADRELV